MLISSKLPSGLHLAHTGEKTPSLPHIRMTVADVTGAGGAVEADESARTWTVEPRAMQLPSKVTVEPDLSNAAPFLGAALIAGGTVRVPHWPETTTQPVVCCRAIWNRWVPKYRSRQSMACAIAR